MILVLNKTKKPLLGSKIVIDIAISSNISAAYKIVSKLM
jgi:hypothetical protein